MTEPACPLTYAGAPVATDPDVVPDSYVTTVKNSDMTASAIDDAINLGLSDYATIDYVDAGDASLVNHAYIDTQDNLRLKLTQKNVGLGATPLDANSRIPVQRINAPITQKWLRGPWTPVAYHGAPVAITAEQTIYSCPITDPGYPYRLMIFGNMEARTNLDTEFPIINIRVANDVSGESIARGYGAADAQHSSIPTAGDQFNVDIATGMGAGWEQLVAQGTGGQYIVDNGKAVWSAEGSDDRTLRYRRTAVADAKTQTNYQRMRVTLGSGIAGSAFIRLCTRMSDSQLTWVGLFLEDGYGRLEYATGGASSIMTGGGFSATPNHQFNAGTDAGTVFDLVTGTATDDRQFLVLRNNVIVAGIIDTLDVTAIGPNNRGWGFISHANGWLFGQDAPPSMDAALIGDVAPSHSSIPIIPINLSAMTVRTGPTTLYIRALRSGSTATITVGNYRPKLSIYAIPA